ncbi:RNA-binding protein [Epibacterium sp. SM1979]|uniref:RNA-binding protein n=1 Tax=Tritonibacter litoralis TaxID=2662264 RepID=A0A843YB94_9RHOB|nr:RNA-binding protein [Tritonibacter litoralis]MQQ08256.1 RNA-binding protein [Tritonibacter litoralis]
MGRAGVKKEQVDGGERKCLATGEVQPKQGLIRFVLSPDMEVFPDVLGKLPGRGVYVSAHRPALETAIKKKLFARGFKSQVKMRDDLIAEVDTQVARRLVDLISLARKSGQAISGYEKVKDWLMKEEARILLQASDGSARGKSKLSTPYKGKFVGCLTANELGMAFGRETVIHAALASGGLSKRVVEEAQRLQGLREAKGGTGRTEG